MHGRCFSVLVVRSRERVRLRLRRGGVRRHRWGSHRRRMRCSRARWRAGRPAGLLPTRRTASIRRRPSASTAQPLGDFFARVAHFEAASVVAFERLHDDLRRLRAPRRLLEAARRSARDEKRHARIMGRMACRFGGELPPVVETRTPRRRSMGAIAVENAVEGCVRETFGALLASWQASHARDEAVARSMRRVAAEEIAARGPVVGHRALARSRDSTARHRVDWRRPAAVPSRRWKGRS